ncbi:MAG: hypothetical protein NT154_07380 [Verrucomicrobia bacterium]|nr:hypothetical protein [Verrucomicrobiota bacterium]
METAPPFEAVDFVYGPKEPINRRSLISLPQGQWWQLEIRTSAGVDTPPQCIVRGLTSADPLAGKEKPHFWRYEVRLPGTAETLEYVESHSGSALLPAWVGFEAHFLPRPAEATRRKEGAPETCAFLGHMLSLHHIGNDRSWEVWPDVKRLELDREMVVGTGRNFKDVEGQRLPQSPQPRNYTYTNFTGADFRTMIAAGMNLFTVAAEQEQWVRTEPVFYLRSPQDQPPLLYPADLYRANYLGPAMFIDEPASILTWDKYAVPVLTHLSDAAELIEQRTRVTFESESPYYGRCWLRQQLHSLGVNLGGLHLAQVELPVWETYYDTAFYEMKGGGSGIVDEARYQLSEFDGMVARFTGVKRPHTVREMLQWHYAFLRGGSRPFTKFWGTAIYGQCDPVIAPQASTTAYEMGARYFWFWTSDHGHHVPWPEQLALARALKAYAREHPRPSIYAPPLKRDKLLLLPNGYFATYADPARMHCLDKEGKNEASQKYQRLMRRTVNAVQDCFRKGEDFDIAIDDGRAFRGYRRVVKLSERE